MRRLHDIFPKLNVDRRKWPQGRVPPDDPAENTRDHERLWLAIEQARRRIFGPWDSTENVGERFGIHSTEPDGTPEAASRVLRATGAHGSTWGPAVSTTPGAGSFEEAVLSIADLRAYWRLGEGASPYADTSGYGTPIPMIRQDRTTDMTQDYNPGALDVDDDGAVAFNYGGDFFGGGWPGDYLGNDSVDQTKLQCQGTDPFTLVAWIKPFAGGAAGMQLAGIAGTYHYDTGITAYAGYALDYDGSTHIVTFRRTKHPTYDTVSGPTLTPNEWTFVVGVFTGTELRLYFNGVLVGSAPSTASMLYANHSFYIGNSSQGSGTGVGSAVQFYGAIDEVALWARALTLSEIELLYAGTSPDNGMPIVPDGEGGVTVGQVGTGGIEDGAVTTPLLADGSVTAAKVADDVATQAELDAHTSDTTDAHVASAISFDPAGTLSSTDVQAAIEEIATEVAEKASFFDGEGDPDSGVGELGDYYLDTDTGAIWERQSAAAEPSLRSTPVKTETFNANLVADNPTGIVAGDLLIAAIMHGYNGGPGLFPAGPTGWTNQGQYYESANQAYHGFFTKVADGTEGSTTTFPHSVGSTPRVVVISAWKNAPAIDVISIQNDFPQTTPGSPKTVNGVTTTEANAVVLIFGAGRSAGGGVSGSVMWSIDAAWTEVWDNITGNSNWTYIASKSMPSPGATGSATLTKSTGNYTSGSFLAFALYEPSVASSWVQIYTPASASGHTIMDEGVALTARADLDFAGDGVTVTDDAVNDKTIVTIPGGGAGGVNAGMTKLYDYTVSGSDKTSIDTFVDGVTVADFAGYDAIEVHALIRTDDAAATANPILTVNNDTSAIYDRSYDGANDGTQQASSSIAATGWNPTIHGAGGSASYAGAMRLLFPNHAGTTFWKTGTMTLASPDATAGNTSVGTWGVGWRSTAAITRLKLAGAGAAKLKVGTRLIVYGIGGSPASAPEQIDYVERATDQTVTSQTSSGTAVTWITGSAVTYDGSTRVKIEARVGLAQTPAATDLKIELWEDGVSLGVIGQVLAGSGAPLHMERFITPTAGSHTYELKAWRPVNSGTSYLVASGLLPAFMRITREARVGMRGHTTIGTTSQGASFDNPGTAPTWYFKKVTLTQDALLTSVLAWVKGDAANGQALTAGVWSDNAGAVGNVVAMANQSTRNAGTGALLQGVLIGTTARQMAFPIGKWLPAGTYWLGVWLGTSVSNSILIAYASGTGADKKQTATANFFQDAPTTSATTNDFSIAADLLV